MTHPAAARLLPYEILSLNFFMELMRKKPYRKAEAVIQLVLDLKIDAKTFIRNKKKFESLKVLSFISIVYTVASVKKLTKWRAVF